MAVINQAQIDRLYGSPSSESSEVVSLGETEVRSGVVGEGGGIFIKGTEESLSQPPPEMTVKYTTIPATKITGSPYIGTGTEVQVSSFNPATNMVETRTEIVGQTGSEILPGTTGTAGGQPLFITPAQQDIIQRDAPIYRVQSPKTPAGMVQAINVESKFARTVTPSQVGVPITSFFVGRKVIAPEEQQFNIRQINRAQRSFQQYVSADKRFQADVRTQSALFQQNPEAFRGRPGFKETDKGYELTGKYFMSLESYKNREAVLTNIEETYGKKYTPEEIYRARQETKGQGLTTGIAAVELTVEKPVLKVARGIANYPFQLMQAQGRSFKTLETPKPIKFGEKITSIPSEPASYKFTEKPFSYLGEAIFERPSSAMTGITVAGAVTLLGKQAKVNIGKLGLKGGTIETARLFSPIRIPSQVLYTPDIENIKVFEGQQVDIKRAGLTETYFRGKGVGAKEVKLSAYQISDKKGGINIGVLKYPQYTIPAGSAVPVQGSGTTTFLTGIAGKPVGIYGFSGTAETIPLYTTSVFPGQATANIYYPVVPKTTKIFGVKIGDEKLFAFASGKRNIFLMEKGAKITSEGIIRDVRFSKWADVNIRGIGTTIKAPTKDIPFDFFNLGKPYTGTIPSGGGVATAVKTGTKTILPTTQTAPLTLQVPKISSAVSSVDLKAGAVGGVSFNQLQKEIIKEEIKFKDLFAIKSETLTQTKQKSATETALVTSGVVTALRNNQTGAQSVAIIPKLAQPTKQPEKSKIIPRQITTPTVPIFKIPRTRIPIIDFPWLFKGGTFPFGIGQQKRYKKFLRRINKSQSKYTASLAAATFQRKPIKVSAKEFKRLSKVKYTGFETRPVLAIDEERDDKIKKAIKKVTF